jgi:putative membrane protein
VSPRLYSVHHLIKAVILFGFAMYIVNLVKTDHILYYIAPRMVDYVKWSAIAFYIIAVYQVYLAFRAFSGGSAACDCEHDHTASSSLLKNTIVYGLFCLPLLLGFVLPDESLGSSLAAKKGMNLSSASNVKKDAAAAQPAPSAGVPAAPGPAGAADGNPAAASGKLDSLFPSDKFTEHYAKFAKELYTSDIISVKEDLYIETLTTVDLYQDQFVGKKIELTGFVYRQDDMKDNQFVVGRFSIQCCSADASPFGLLVEYDRAQSFQNDHWVTVTGTIKKTKFNDMDILVVKVDKIGIAEPAKTQYVYPNFDFGL